MYEGSTRIIISKLKAIIVVGELLVCTEVDEVFCIPVPAFCQSSSDCMLVMILSVFTIGVVVEVVRCAVGLSSLAGRPNSKSKFPRKYSPCYFFFQGQ